MLPWYVLNIVYQRNCVFQTAYHVIWCPKYRKQILKDEIAKYLSDLIDTICKENKWRVISKEIQSDHVHLFLSISPAFAVATVVKTLKGTTARKLFLNFPDLKKEVRGGHLWSPSYYVGTAGNVSAQIIQKYIERSEHLRGRR